MIGEGGLIRFVHILPVLRASEIFLFVIKMIHAPSHESNAEIVVSVFDCAGDGASEGSNAVRIEVICGNVAQILPAGQAASSFYGPVLGLILIY